MTESGEELKLVGGGEFFAVHNNLCLLGSAVVSPCIVGHVPIKILLQFPEGDFTVTVTPSFRYFIIGCKTAFTRRQTPPLC